MMRLRTGFENIKNRTGNDRINKVVVRKLRVGLWQLGVVGEGISLGVREIGFGD